MRDNTIQDAFRQMGDQVGSDVTTLAKQNMLMRTRIDAIEKLLFHKRGSLLKLVLLNLLSPKVMMRALDAQHRLEIAEINRQMEEARKSVIKFRRP